jgi:hypothetical protein
MKDQAEMPTLVHTPPHLADELTREMKAGAKVGVRGVRPRGAHLIAAPAVTAENGRQIVDRCPEHDRKHPKLDHRKMEAKGTVRLSLFGPKGELRGALLADGTILRLSPKEAKDVAGLLAPGTTVAAISEGMQARPRHRGEVDRRRVRRSSAGPQAKAQAQASSAATK